ncbi:MAG: aldose 1-epimerase family protein [Chitinophagales bacterium]|nr:aldose 1-epimerase family protein [Chitinophagales bacterium]MDW8394317.1 aldose 1-epimerase family protein [Chitinophagales bacterium]
MASGGAKEVVLDNGNLRVVVSHHGAELQRIFSYTTNLDYLWSGDARFWNRRSPVLFPIVGALKNNTYYYQGRPYTLNRHGFARDQDFVSVQGNAESAGFALHSNGRFISVYPFEFALYLNYSLSGDRLRVSYCVHNCGREVMYFSLGAHPAFRVPLVPGTRYDDWYLEWEQPESLQCHRLNAEGLLYEQHPFLHEERRIPLKYELFFHDALVLQPRSQRIALKSDRFPHGLELAYPGFPFLGLWSAPNADFVCLEPWIGHADPVDTDQQLEHKPGMITLLPDQQFTASWQVSFF